MVVRIKTGERISRLRELMRRPEYDIQAYIVPSEDAHQSEYIAPCDARRAYISGFSGSAGCAAVTLGEAALFTDGRYFLQASQQLDDNWTLMKSGMPLVPTWQEWLGKVVPKGGKVGIDPTLISAAEAFSLSNLLKDKGVTLQAIEKNLVDDVWTDRPARPKNPITVLPINYAGKSHEDKITSLREQLTAQKAKGFVVSMLDEIAWLFNLRGSDIQYNPVFFAYSIVTMEDVILFVDEDKVTPEVKAHLGSSVCIKPYDSIFEHLQVIRKELAGAETKFLSGTRGSLALSNSLGKDNTIEVRSPLLMAKAVKNDTELEGIRQAHLRDGAALISYFAWLEDELLKKGNASISEADGADKLEEFRAQQRDFIGLSFDTISSIGPNGAIIHYKPERGQCDIICKEKLYLCDSGGQYRDGTTDVTRTLHFGHPTDFERVAFTRVLQGHIALDSCVFPRGTTGYNLDPIARIALWKEGLDYRHGTGHGVGAFLNVHEGPQGIGTRITYNDIQLLEGMTVTNEPGYYDDGNFGVRLENIMLVVEVQTPNNFGSRGYLRFEHVTYVPIAQRKMLDMSILSAEEIQWINNYHRECLERVGPLLKDGSPAKKWLERECLPLTQSS